MFLPLDLVLLRDKDFLRELKQMEFERVLTQLSDFFLSTLLLFSSQIEGTFTHQFENCP